MAIFEREEKLMSGAYLNTKRKNDARINSLLICYLSCSRALNVQNDTQHNEYKKLINNNQKTKHTLSLEYLKEIVASMEYSDTSSMLTQTMNFIKYSRHLLKTCGTCR